MENSKEPTSRQSSGKEDEILQRIELLTTIGKNVEGTSPSVDITKRPDYLDESRFDSAQKVVNKYYNSSFMASSMGLMLLLQLKQILVPLLKTGKSRTVSDLYDRYTATAIYIKRCYESRFYDQASDGWRYISIVRSMHQRIYKIMNEDEKNRELLPVRERNNLDYVWVNQYDMALTQFAFIGLFLLRPDKCGARNISRDEMREVVYFWRLLSHQFGVEERFNLFVYHEELDKQLKLMEIIFDQYKQQLAPPRIGVGVKMAEGFLLAFEDLAKEVNFNIVEHHWFEVISLSGRQELLPYQGIDELWMLARFKTIFILSSSSDWSRRLTVRVYKRKLEKFCSKGQKMREKLTKKYPNITYELSQGLEG